jgi:hypothetical protein
MISAMGVVSSLVKFDVAIIARLICLFKFHPTPRSSKSKRKGKFNQKRKHYARGRCRCSEKVVAV